MRFEYFEIRAAVETDTATTSFRGDPVWDDCRGDFIITPATAEAAAERFNAREGGKGVFWTLYGMDGGIATAVGDFKTFDDAFEVMNAILAPMAEARDKISHRDDGPARAADLLDDFINQCSNEERL